MMSQQDTTTQFHCIQRLEAWGKTKHFDCFLAALLQPCSAVALSHFYLLDQYSTYACPIRLTLVLGAHHVSLIHKHFDITDGEAMVFRDIALPAHGTVEVMRATAIASAQLHGTHFLVNSAAQLQAYEYTTEPTIDISEYGIFVAEFVNIVVERQLQHKFGLKLKHHREGEVKVDRKEFEFPEEQCTITIPVNLPLPETTHKIDVDTDWGALDIKHERKRAGSTRTGCSHSHARLSAGMCQRRWSHV